MSLRRKYRKPKLPTRWFVLVDDSGADDGPFRPRDFAHMGDGVWVAQTEGHPVFLRIKRQKDNEIWSEDGAGKLWHYRIVPIHRSAISPELAAATQRGA